MRSSAVVAIAVAWLALPSSSKGQTLTLNPADPKHAEYTHGNRKDRIESGDEIRVSSPYNVSVLVTGQNNAFYDCKLSTEPLDVPEVKALQQFLSAASPYLLEVGRLAAGKPDLARTVAPTAPAARGAPRTANDLEQRLNAAESTVLSILRTIDALEASAPVRATRALEAELGALDSLLWSGHGLHAVRLGTLATLDTMSRSPQVDVDLRTRFRARSRITCEDAKCQELPLVRALLAAYPTLQLRYRDLDEASEITAATAALARLANARANLRESRSELAALKREIDSQSPGQENDRSRRIAELVESAGRSDIDAPLPDPKGLSAAAKKALEESGGVLTLAYATQALALRAANATSDWACDAVGVDWDKGRTVTVNITPRTEPELARLAKNGPIAFKAEVQPRWFVSPSVGLALLYAPDAVFTTYGTNDVTGGKQIVDTGTQDKRVNYGLTLSLAWPWIQDWLPSSVRVNLPDITINPSEDTRALGLGAGLTLGLFKVGSGLLWTKHSALDGQELGDVVSTLKSRDRYGRSLYFSFSVVGWPPFLKSE